MTLIRHKINWAARGNKTQRYQRRRHQDRPPGLARRRQKLEAPVIRALNRRLKGKLSEQIQKSKFTGAEGSSLSYSTAGTLPASHLLLVGFGKANDVNSDTWRRAGARARKEASVVGAQEIAVFFAPDKDPDGAAGAVVEGAMLASYRFNKYRSNSNPGAAVKTLTCSNPASNEPRPWNVRCAGWSRPFRAYSWRVIS
jgi:leucyl aminopeptidase